MAADIFLILMGLTVLLLVLRTRKNNLFKHGEKTDGVIVDYEISSQKNDTNKYPIVRFTTQKDESYTLASADGFLPGRVKKGKKVSILYNPQNPQEFTIQLANEKLMFVTLVGGAVLFTLTGCILLLNELNVIHLFKK